MKLLTISSASDILSISLTENEKLIGSTEIIGHKSHAENITPAINKMLNSKSIEIVQLEGIAVNLGPGSFTGLRVGLSMAKGLAFGANLKLYAYTNFEEIICGAIHKYALNGKTSVLIPSRKNEFYFGAFDIKEKKFQQLDKLELMTLEEYLSHQHNFDFIITDEKSAQSLTKDISLNKFIIIQNNAYWGALLVNSNPQKFLYLDYFYLEPMYLKNFEPKIKTPQIMQ